MHRALDKLREERPELNYRQMLNANGKQYLDAVEPSSEEAAWHLLDLRMSESSRKVKNRTPRA